MMKKYIKPNADLSLIETTDVITTSSGEQLDDIVSNVTSSSAMTQAFDFTKLFE